MSTADLEVRLRIWYSKRGDLRFLGHRDLLRACERWFRRADLQLQFSQGFHPRALMNFPSALAVGIAGEEELMEVVLVNPPALTQLEQRLRQTAYPGLELLRLELLPRHSAKPRVVAAEYEIHVPEERQAAAQLAVMSLMAAPTWIVDWPRKADAWDVRAGILDLRLDPDQCLRMRLVVDQSGSVRPREVLQALELQDLESNGFELRRVRVELRSQETH